MKSNGRGDWVEKLRTLSPRGGRRLTTLFAADISTETARFQRLNLAVDDVTDAAYNGIRCYDVDRSSAC